MIDRALDRLTRRLVGNIPYCTLWRYEPMQSGLGLHDVRRNCFGEIVSCYSMSVWHYRLGRFSLSEQFVEHYPKGGWTWQRLVEILVRGG